MDSTLRKIEEEDIIFYEEKGYKDIDREKFMSVFQKMTEDGIIKSRFDDETWITFSGVKKCTLDFRFNEIKYMTHFKKRANVPVSRFGDMLRCFALYLAGTYIMTTISEKLGIVIEFACRIGDKKYSITTEQSIALKEFMYFIGLSAFETENLLKLVKLTDSDKGGQRELAHMINYMAIADAVNSLYSSQISDEDYIRWFPIYFWVNITFIIPLRATEMMVTPYDCFEYKGDEIRIRLRRTQLKKKSRTVRYKVYKDYKVFTYKIPHTGTVDVVEKYRSLTCGHERQFLFDYSRYAVNDMLSLQSFNNLLSDFVKMYLIGNKKYDFALYMSNIPEFVPVTAGDSRPIAMASLFFQDVGAEVCMELADHMNISTSAKYYTNVSKTVYATSIIEIQNKINEKREQTDDLEKEYAQNNELPAAQTSVHGCYSSKRPHETGDISDCIEQEHIHECLGCKYYHPNKQQLETALKQRRKRLDDAARMVFKQIADKDKIKARERDFDRIFLEAHTSITRYKTACDSNAMEASEKWHRKRNIQKSS